MGQGACPLPPSQGRNTPRGGNAAHRQAKRAERAQGRARPPAPTQAERSDPQHGGADGRTPNPNRAVGGNAERGSRRRAAKTRGGGGGERRQGGGGASHEERSPPDEPRPSWPKRERNGATPQNKDRARTDARGKGNFFTQFSHFYHKILENTCHCFSQCTGILFTIPHCDRVG